MVLILRFSNLQKTCLQPPPLPKRVPSKAEKKVRACCIHAWYPIHYTHQALGQELNMTGGREHSNPLN